MKVITNFNMTDFRYINNLPENPYIDKSYLEKLNYCDDHGEWFKLNFLGIPIHDYIYTSVKYRKTLCFNIGM